MAQPNFELSAEDHAHVAKIVERTGDIINRQYPDFDRLSMTMDIIACHNHAQPLDLKRLAEADDFNLIHDTIGIRKHLNRETLALNDCFLPRFAQKEGA